VPRAASEVRGDLVGGRETLARARTCDDCFFRRKGLCALATTVPCPTFREMRDGRITAPRQPPLVAPTSGGRVVAAAMSR
jgi:hypothetical protein